MGDETRVCARKRSPRSGRWCEVAELASRQHGVVSVRQLRRLGLGDDAVHDRARRGSLHRLHRGVYAVGHVALTRRSRQLAAVLAAGPGALLSHRSAAELWAVVRPGSAGVEVTAPRARRARAGFTLHRSRDIAPSDRAVVDGIPVTSPRAPSSTSPTS